MERAFSPKIILREIEQHGMRLDELSGDLEHHIRRKLDWDASHPKAIVFCATKRKTDQDTKNLSIMTRPWDELACPECGALNVVVLV